MNALQERIVSDIDAMASKAYNGQGYMPVAIIKAMYDRADVQLDAKIACFDKFTQMYLKAAGHKYITLFDNGTGFLETNMRFDFVVGNPPYDGYLHLQFLSKAVDTADKVVFIEPAAFLIAEESKNKQYKSIINKIDGHVSHVILDDPKSFFGEGCILNGQQLAVTYIDTTKTFDKVTVEYRMMNKTIQLDSINQINSFGNNPLYDSFKKKVLAAANEMSLNDAFEKKMSKQYCIQIGDLSNYCFFGEYKGKGGKGGLRKVEEYLPDVGASFDDKEVAEAAFTYLRNPIAILALHISKKNMHVHASTNTVPWFTTVEDFLDPASAMGLTAEEVAFALHVQENSATYFRF